MNSNEVIVKVMPITRIVIKPTLKFEPGFTKQIIFRRITENPKDNLIVNAV